MTSKLGFRRWRAAVSMVAAMAAVVPIIYGAHSWGNYHWSRTSNPFTLNLGDNVSSTWDPYLTTASADWSLSPSPILTSVVTSGIDPRKCRATSGRVEVCTASYGGVQWLGIASIWVSGDHIVQATVKLNDFWFNQSYYNTVLWRQSVMCQEIGHTFGLDHQDEDFELNDLNSCMDYQDPPYASPNAHDYEQLLTIYAHTDAPPPPPSGGGKGKGGGGLPSGFTGLDVDGPGQWGRQVASLQNGKEDVYEADFGGGNRIITFVRRPN